MSTSINATGYDQANKHVNFIDQFAHKKLAGLKDKVVSLQEYMDVMNDSINKLSKVVFDAPEEYDTLKEIAIYLHDNDIHLEETLVKLNNIDNKLMLISNTSDARYITLIKLINTETERTNKLLEDYYTKTEIDNIIKELKETFSPIVANPELDGTEEDLTAISINGKKFKLTSSKDLSDLALTVNTTLKNQVDTIENNIKSINNDVASIKDFIIEAETLKEKVEANTLATDSITKYTITNKIKYICIDGGTSAKTLTETN